MLLEFPRGDQFPLEIPITDNEDNLIQESDIDEITITCRERPFKDSPILFQKKLSKGEITYDNESKIFIAWIMKEDTKDLFYCEYGFDIEVRAGQVIDTRKGVIRLTEEYTICE